jgi:plasmid maintenance system killer protein
VIILFKDPKFGALCNDQKQLKKKMGEEQAKKVTLRLADMAAAPTLAVLRTLPQNRCHELVGDRAGQLSVDLKHPYRLIFEPADDPVPYKPDGGLDWQKVTAVRILEVEDTHG